MKNCTSKVKIVDQYTTDEDKENRSSNIPKKPMRKEIKFGKKVSRNDIKNIDLNCIKFHKTFIDHNGNTINQICLNNDKEL